MRQPKAVLYKHQKPHMAPPPAEREPREVKNKKKRKPYADYKPITA